MRTKRWIDFKPTLSITFDLESITETVSFCNSKIHHKKMAGNIADFDRNKNDYTRIEKIMAFISSPHQVQ